MMKTLLKSMVGYHAVMVQLHERAGTHMVKTMLAGVGLLEDRLPGDKKETA